MIGQSDLSGQRNCNVSDTHSAAAAGNRERIRTTLCTSSFEAAEIVAKEIADLIRARQAAGKRAVLGLATGSTPVGVYDELVRLHKHAGLSFENVTTFNLDEYWPMEPQNLQSYRRFMQQHLFDHVNIDQSRTNVPDGRLARNQIDAYCAEYEKQIVDAGGIDYQILGIGRTGHIGFNEPGSPLNSRTRLITLDRVTRMDASSDFFGEWNVPTQAITMGVGTILSAKRIAMLAFGEHKAGIIRRAVEEPITAAVVASYLQNHQNAALFLDAAAAAELTKHKAPWLLGPVAQFGLTWNAELTRRAVIWLAQLLSKPITKLTDADYSEHGLQELLASRGGCYDINIEVFRLMQRTITGWPGGKAGRPRFVPGRGIEHSGPADTHPKRIVVFSPHPDDDVISMGGTFIRLCEQEHDVHVAYQTSGNIAVWDESAERHADFAAEFCRVFHFEGASQRAAALADEVQRFIQSKKTGDVDTPELRAIKGLIRRTEARAGARYSGVKPDNIHFLDLPFYETGTVKKSRLGTRDIEQTVALLDKVRPHMIFAAGDLSDPHGTHRVCLRCILLSLEAAAGRDWRRDCELWLYRGAWQEWGPHEIDMAVPLSPSEVDRKRRAIFKHESQKDTALFPGPNDPREFWQRAEDRNRRTAELYDSLGLPEYQAIEGFVLWRPGLVDARGPELAP